MQNTQYDFCIYGDGIDMSSTINNLKAISTYMFVPISPNVNWKNLSHWNRTKQIFCPHFQQTHLSAICSNMGLDPLYIN